MLQKLHIRNYAIIDELDIRFQEGLNVITGETGAGKSILVGALSLLLGDRADSSLFSNTKEKCIIEASFLLERERAERFKAILEESELDYDNPTILRREITPAGKSRSFVNDTPVTSAILQKVSPYLIDLHRQFDTQALKGKPVFYTFLDAIAGNKKQLRAYTEALKEYKTISSRLETLITQQNAWQKEADYNQFLLEELESADWQPDEIENLSEQLRQIEHSEQITQGLQAVQYTLEDSDAAVNPALRKLLQNLQEIEQYFPSAGELSARLESAWLELRDIAEESLRLVNQAPSAQYDPDVLQERMDEGYRLLKKHQVQTTAELLATQEGLKTGLDQKLQLEETIEQLRAESQQALSVLSESAERLSKRRRETALPMAEQINHSLKQIGMPNARFQVDVDELDSFTEHGKDEVRFLWDANKSGNLLPLQKAASGGELSRLMLCIKTLTAKAMELPTLLFDEVDSGISGEAAMQVGAMLKALSQDHQIICITHQPQVAAKGKAHFYVYKSLEREAVQTRIRQLNADESVEAIARMIGGDQPSDAALKSAKELSR